MVGWNDRLKVGGFWKMGVGFFGNSFFRKEERRLSAVSLCTHLFSPNTALYARSQASDHTKSNAGTAAPWRASLSGSRFFVVQLR